MRSSTAPDAGTVAVSFARAASRGSAAAIQFMASSSKRPNSTRCLASSAAATALDPGAPEPGPRAPREPGETHAAANSAIAIGPAALTRPSL